MKRLAVLSWAVLISAALAVFIFKGLFAPVAYHIDLFGDDHDYGPAIFSMGALPVAFAFALYIIKKLEGDKQRARIGIIFCAIMLPIAQLSLAYIALSN